MNIVHCFRSPVGGLFRHVADLARTQSAAGHRVGLICDSSTGGALEERIFETLRPSLELGLLRIPMRRGIGPSDLIASWRVRGRIGRQNPDVLHGHGAKGGAYARFIGTLLRATGNSVARIYTPHGGSLHYESGSAAGRVYFTIERGLTRLTDAFAFVSQYEADTFAAKVGRLKRPAVIVPNGLRPEEFEPVSPADGSVDFLFIGMLRDLKGPDVFVAALKQLADTRAEPPTALVVGDGPDRESLLATVGDAGLSDRVAFRDPMPAREAFALARAVVVPSRAESMPYIVLEAIAAGLPLVATDVGGIPEIFGEDSAALVAPGQVDDLARAMGTLLDGSSDAAARTSRLRSRIREHFSVGEMAARVDEAYRAARAR